LIRSRICATVVVALAITAVFHVAVGSAAPAECPGAAVMPVDRPSQTQAARGMLCLVNRTRAAYGLRRVRRSRQLDAVARGHSADMVAREYFAHDGPGGDTLYSRVRNSGYAGTHPGYAVEEALAWGAPVTPAELMNSLMGSDTHRRILLDRGAREVGLGLVLGAPEADVDGPSATLVLEFAS